MTVNSRGIRIFLAIAAVAVLIASPFAYKAFKQKRAENMALEAKENWQLNGMSREVLDQAQAAFYLAPENLVVIQTYAEIITEIDAGRGIFFWDKVVKLSNGSLTARLGLVRARLKSNSLKKIGPLLEGLKEYEDDFPEILVLKAKMYAKMDDIENAIQAVRQAIDAGDVDPATHILYARLTQRSSDERQRTAGMKHLWALAKQKDALGLVALTTLARNKTLSPSEVQLLFDSINNHPNAQREEKLIAMNMRLRTNLEEQESTIEDAKLLFDAKNPEELYALGRWLNSRKLYAKTIVEIPEETARGRKDLFLVRLDAMASLNQWEAIEKSLNQPEIPLEKVLVYLFKTRVFLETGRKVDAELEWDRGLLDAYSSEQSLWLLANYASKLRLPNFARLPLEKLTAFPGSMRKAYTQLIHIEQNSGNTEGMLAFLERMATEFPSDPAIQNDLVYIKFLIGKDASDLIIKAEEAVEDNPKFLAYRITLGLGFLRSGAAEKALPLFLNTKVNWNKVNPRWRAVLASILWATDNKKEAERLKQGIDPGALLPEERELIEFTGIP